MVLGGFSHNDDVTCSPVSLVNVMCRYNGEVYDARLAQPNWAVPGFVPSVLPWRPVKEVDLPDGSEAALSARLFPPIRVVKEVKPINVTVLDANGSFFYDLGNNYAGVARVSLPAGMPAGTTIAVVCTEYLAVAEVPWGPADQYNQQDLYVCFWLSRAAA